MMGVHVTAHAIERYRERVADLADDEVRARLSSPAILAGVELGSCKVKLPGGQRVVIVNGVVVTVTPRPSIPRCRTGKPLANGASEWA